MFKFLKRRSPETVFREFQDMKYLTRADLLEIEAFAATKAEPWSEFSTMLIVEAFLEGRAEGGTWDGGLTKLRSAAAQDVHRARIQLAKLLSDRTSAAFDEQGALHWAKVCSDDRRCKPNEAADAYRIHIKVDYEAERYSGALRNSLRMLVKFGYGPRAQVADQLAEGLGINRSVEFAKDMYLAEIAFLSDSSKQEFESVMKRLKALCPDMPRKVEVALEAGETEWGWAQRVDRRVFQHVFGVTSVGVSDSFLFLE